MPWYPNVIPVPSTSTVSQMYTGRPIIGPVVDTTSLPRVLIGWNHQDDTPEGLMKGQLYCSVSRNANPKLQIFDTSGNRSNEPGVVVFCGVANFTMVRMFHPYWAEAGPGGTLPRDMAFRPDHEDKARLRQLYHEFLSDHYGLSNNGQPVYPVPADDYAGNDDTAGATVNANDQSLFIPEDGQGAAGNSKDGQPKKKRGRLANPDGPCRKRQPRKRPSNKDAGLALLFPDPDKMAKQDERRQYALNNGESVKSESLATSVTAQLQNGLPLNTPRNLREHLISLDASPGRNIFNVIDLDKFEGQLEEQNAQFLSSQSSSNPSQVTNLADNYKIDPEAERWKTDRASEEILSRWGIPAQTSASAAAPTSNSPQPSNDGLQDSFETDETDEQDAQVVRRGSSDTLIANNNDDLQIIEQLEVKPDMEEIEIDV